MPPLPSNSHSQPRAVTSDLLLSREVWCHPFALLLPHYLSCLKGERKQEAGLRPFRDCIAGHFNKLGTSLSHVEVQSTIQPEGSLYRPQTCSCCSWKHASSRGPHPGEVPARPPAAVGCCVSPRRARSTSLLLCWANKSTTDTTAGEMKAAAAPAPLLAIASRLAPCRTVPSPSNHSRRSQGDSGYPQHREKAG